MLSTSSHFVPSSSLAIAKQSHSLLSDTLLGMVLIVAPDFILITMEVFPYSSFDNSVMIYDTVADFITSSLAVMR